MDGLHAVCWNHTDETLLGDPVGFGKVAGEVWLEFLTTFARIRFDVWEGRVCSRFKGTRRNSGARSSRSKRRGLCRSRAFRVTGNKDNKVWCG